MDKIKYFLREYKEWILGLSFGFLLYMIIGIFLTMFIYGVGSRHLDKYDPHPYCYWKPERILTAVYWTIEYLPRKATCGFLESWDILNKKKEISHPW